MRMWGTRSQRLASLLAVTVLVLALPGCGGSSNNGGGGTPAVTATFVSNDPVSSNDLVRFSSANCVNDTCTLTISIGPTSANNYFAFAFDILISNTSIARFELGSDRAGSFLIGTADSLAAQTNDRVVIGVTKTGGTGNGTGSEAEVMTLTFRMTGTGDATLTFVGSPNNPNLGSCSQTGPEAIDDQTPFGDCIPSTVFGLGGTITGS